MSRRTKIVCTIGPASGSPAVIARLLESGMDVARLNFAHGDLSLHRNYITDLRHVAAKRSRPLAILQDLPGPKDRTGKLKTGQVDLKTGAEFTLTTRRVIGDMHIVSVGLESLPRDVKAGNAIYLSDGRIRLEVVKTSGTEVKCRVLAGGTLGENQGINAPGVQLTTPTVTRRDLMYLDFGIKAGVDFVGLSFVRSATDVEKVKAFIRRKGSHQAVIAKIEKSEALDNLDGIIDAADGIMVARGDLGVETAIERVPLVQKDIIRKCNRLGKPVIVATQMLESMVSAGRPTRAEVTDVANAIFDGTDAVMLSAETAVGKYPQESVATMSRIAVETEAALPYGEILRTRGEDYGPETDDAISYAACRIAEQVGAVGIVAFTHSGSTARRVSRYRPRVPVLAITSNRDALRRLSLVWGTQAYRVPTAKKIADLFAEGALIARQSGVAKSGDIIVITGGVPVGVSGGTNLLKVERIQ